MTMTAKIPRHRIMPYGLYKHEFLGRLAHALIERWQLLYGGDCTFFFAGLDFASYSGGGGRALHPLRELSMRMRTEYTVEYSREERLWKRLEETPQKENEYNQSDPRKRPVLFFVSCKFLVQWSYEITTHLPALEAIPSLCAPQPSYTSGYLLANALTAHPCVPDYPLDTTDLRYSSS